MYENYGDISLEFINIVQYKLEAQIKVIKGPIKKSVDMTKIRCDKISNSYYDMALEIRQRKILKYKAEIAKMEAKTISYVVYLNQRISLTEYQDCITIGHDETCNLRINDPLYIASIHCTISIRKTKIKESGFETFIKNSPNKRTFVNKKLLEPNEEHILNHNDKILVKTRDGFIATTSYKKSYYDPCLDLRYMKIQKLKHDIAKAEAKAISSVVYLNEKVVLSEVQNRITIGRDLAANLTINNPTYVASIQCILSIRKTDNMHYVKELDFETVIKNGWNRRTFVNNKHLEPNEEQVLNHNDKILIKTEEDFIEVRFFEDAKTDPENQFREEKNRLPAQSGERYHVINNEDGSNDHIEIGKSCIVKKIRSNNRNDENIYAAKIINVSDGKFDQNRIFEYRNEIDILKMLNHENIIKVVDDYFDKENIVIILPYFCGGSLEDYIKTLNDSNFNQVKLIDFGESKKIEGSIDSMGNYIEQTSTDLVGTPLFVAPELAKAFKDRIVIFTTDNDSAGDTAQYEYDKSIDIWSFGIVNYYMLSKKYPWNVNIHVREKRRPEDYIELYDNIMKGDLDFSTFKTIRSDINEIENVMDFILKLCQVNRDQRMSSDQALQHTIFS
ncbi:12966_t:CDS:2 [Entrophospora sp. SA101]|nr:12966_t:CDS:2 [Entrophospora sp. SA101]